MASVADRVRDTTTTTGTGNLTLSGTAPVGFQTFADAFPLDKLFYYCIQTPSGAEWEVGDAYLTGSTTLVRYEVYASSNAGALVNLSAGTKEVFCTMPAYQYQDKGQVLAQARGQALP